MPALSLFNITWKNPLEHEKLLHKPYFSRHCTCIDSVQAYEKGTQRKIWKFPDSVNFCLWSKFLYGLTNCIVYCMICKLYAWAQWERVSVVEFWISDQISGTWIFRFGVPARKEVRPQRQTNKSNKKIFQLKKFKSYQQDRTVWNVIFSSFYVEQSADRSTQMNFCFIFGAFTRFLFLGL